MERFSVFCGECGREIVLEDVKTDRETRAETIIIVKPHKCWTDNAEVLKCPKCESEKLTVQRIQGGKSWLICLDCGYNEEV
jgi:hypothetical protein